MASINKNELTHDQIEKAMNCKTAEELMALANAEGIELTKEEAEAYLAEFGDCELDAAKLKNVAGGAEGCYKFDCTQQTCVWVDCPIYFTS